MSTDTYTVGFVSSPHPHSAYHVKTLDVLDEVQAIHLCGLAGEDTDTLAAQSSKVASKSGSVEEMLARGQLDAMMVSVRNDLCPGVLEAAAAAGVPVLFEKPGALRASDLRRIADMARDKGVTMGAMYQNRWSPMNQEVRRIVQAGALGRVMSAESRMVTSQVKHRDPSHWLFGRATGGSGILSWLACHHIDMLCYIMDDRIVEVAAMVGNQNREKVEVEDTAMLTLRFRSGGPGHSTFRIPPDAEPRRLRRRLQRQLHGVPRSRRPHSDAGRCRHPPDGRLWLGRRGQTRIQLRVSTVGGVRRSGGGRFRI